MKAVFLIPTGFLLAFGGMLSAQTPAVPGPSPVKREMEKLTAERSRLISELAGVRKRYINTDPHIREMHERIMEMHREFSLVLEGKKDVRELNDKLRKNDLELKKLKKMEK